MTYKSLSEKQLKAMFWWVNGSGCEHYDAVICDGAVRSGKTFALSLSFVLWASVTFDGALLGFCGKTITALRRNVIIPLLPCLKELGFDVKESVSNNRLTIRYGQHENTFFLFSGKDEGSASLIQGVTLSGVLFDEVALMPKSFVEQALARCSVSGSRFFFNCNPEYPSHWFYREWIQNRKRKNALYIHFRMRDNPSLSQKMLKRYESLYTGAFYRRFIEGEWVSVSGAVYPFMGDSSMFIPPPDQAFEEYCVSCDYGTVNPTSMGLWGRIGNTWYRLRESYYDARKEGKSRTDEEHYNSLTELLDELLPTAVIVDPSAASFITLCKQKGRFSVRKADNAVLEGIQNTAVCLARRDILVNDCCKNTIKEFNLYSWDEKKDRDAVIKENDHAMDALRYFVQTKRIYRKQTAYRSVFG